MLVVVFLLVLAAGGVLVWAVLSGQPDSAWFSVLLSGIGVLLLGVDRFRRRRAQRSSAESAAGSAGPEFADADDEPAAELVSAADAAAVAELSEQVLVVDERPRYHLPGCDWLVGRETVALSLSEARELGFTPCGRCEPVSTLVARVRDAD